MKLFLIFVIISVTIIKFFVDYFSVEIKIK